MKKQLLSPEQISQIIRLLKTRFQAKAMRHVGYTWMEVEARLRAYPEVLRSLFMMEVTGGEPELIQKDAVTDEFIFYDCSPESPAGRRSLCYDQEALEARKDNKPKGSALGMAAAMGISLLTEDEYWALQQFGEFDRKTSSWILTPSSVRKKGGAFFGDRRYDEIFTYHNGAESYYASRGFRGVVGV